MCCYEHMNVLQFSSSAHRRSERVSIGWAKRDSHKALLLNGHRYCIMSKQHKRGYRMGLPAQAGDAGQPARLEALGVERLGGPEERFKTSTHSAG